MVQFARFLAARLFGALGRATRDARGATAVEFAFVAPIVIALVLGTIQIAVIFLAKAELETITEASARLVLTNQSASLTNATTFKAAVCANIPALFTCSNVMVDLQPATSITSINTGAPTLTYDSSGKVTNTWNYNAGTPNQIMVLKVMYQWPVITGPLGVYFADLSNGTLFMMATAVFKNESQ